jgi:hypothetical protein
MSCFIDASMLELMLMTTTTTTTTTTTELLFDAIEGAAPRRRLLLDDDNEQQQHVRGTSSSSSSSSSSWPLQIMSWPSFGQNMLWNREASEGVSSEALLGSNNNDNTGNENYSMTSYFTTFIMDVYNGFRSMHVVLQAIAIICMLIITFKLLSL